MLMPPTKAETVVVPAGLKNALPAHCQSPAVKETEVRFAGTPLVSETVASETEDEMYSPTLPALALSAAVVPTIPDVVDGVNVLVDVSVVNLPLAAAVPPMAGGDARYVEKPEPDTVEEADNVVNDPPAAAVPPMAGGDAR